jgi:hypothetical protein
VNNTCAYSSLLRHPGVIEAEPGLLWKDITVRVRTLDSLLAEWNPPRLDVLSVDTEGTELDVLKGIDLNRWAPKVIIAELWDETHGVHDDPITPYLKERGYRLLERVGENNRYLIEGFGP